MKLNSILGCALVTGLMAFASNNAQAKDLVISNEVYAPFNLKLDVQYPDTAGKKFQKATLTTKQYLKDTYPQGAQMLVNTQTREVWVANKNGDLLVNLATSTNGTSLTIGLSFFVQVSPKDNSYDQIGTFHINAVGVDHFALDGKYDRKYSFGKVDKDGNVTYSDDLQATDLSGSGNFVGLSEEDLPITGSCDFKGSGKIVD